MKLTTRILTVGKPTLNGNIYDKVTIEEALARLGGRPVYGQLGMTGAPTMDTTLISHQASNLRIEDDALVADIETLDTPSGRELVALIEDWQSVGHPIGNPGCFGFRPSGVGTTDKVGAFTFVTDYTLWSINAVDDGA